MLQQPTGQGPGSPNDANTGSRTHLGNGDLIRKGADIVVRVMEERTFFGRYLDEKRSLDESLPNRAEILNTDKLNKLVGDARNIATLMDNKEGLNRIQVQEYARIAGDLTRLAVVVMDCCAHISKNHLPESQAFLTSGASLSFASAKTLSKAGELQKIAADYFPQIGLAGHNFRLANAFF